VSPAGPSALYPTQRHPTCIGKQLQPTPHPPLPMHRPAGGGCSWCHRPGRQTLGSPGLPSQLGLEASANLKSEDLNTVISHAMSSASSIDSKQRESLSASKAQEVLQQMAQVMERRVLELNGGNKWGSIQIIQI